MSKVYITCTIPYKNLEDLLTSLVKYCNTGIICTVGDNLSCPLSKLDDQHYACGKVTKEDWLKVIKIEPYL